MENYRQMSDSSTLGNEPLVFTEFFDRLGKLVDSFPTKTHTCVLENDCRFPVFSVLHVQEAAVVASVVSDNPRLCMSDLLRLLSQYYSGRVSCCDRKQNEAALKFHLTPVGMAAV